MINISNKETLKEYLIKKGIIKANDDCTIHYCKGGVSCTVAYVDLEEQPMIIKQALAQLKTKDVWLCDPNRMYIEYESNKIYHDLLPNNAPQIYFYDEENYIYGREAVPDGCLMWKEYLMNGIINYNIGTKSIDTLSTVHNKCSGNEKVKKMFEKKDVFYNLRISPYIEFTVSKHPEIATFAERISNEMMESSITLVHGDYSPKNIMVTEDGIKVLDFEVAHFGHPAFDLAFFSNHFILKAVKFNEYADGYLTFLNYMIKRYFDQLKYMNKDDFEDTYIRTLAILMLARVDGKSPVEYLIGEPKKQAIVRDLSFTMINYGITTFKDTMEMVKNKLCNKEAFIHGLYH